MTLQDGQYRLSTKQWPNHFVYMQDGYTGNVASWRDDPGPQGYWQLRNHPDIRGYFLLSPRKWPDCFIFMEYYDIAGNIRGWSNCDPGPQGYWKLVERKNDTGEDFFLLTCQQWEREWFVYVECGLSGNLSAWRGDPGPQGWFKLDRSVEALHGVPGAQFPMTSERLASMPKLWDPASGYSGPSELLTRPQLLSEIRLEVTRADGVSWEAMHPSQRTIVFHVDQSRSFAQRVGRQYQQAFFEEFVPDRAAWAGLSRSIFELRLDPPADTPTLVKLSSSGVLCVGQSPIQTNEKRQVGHNSRIGLGSTDVFLEFNVKLVRSSQQQMLATRAGIPGAKGAMPPGTRLPGGKGSAPPATRPPQDAMVAGGYPSNFTDSSPPYAASPLSAGMQGFGDASSAPPRHTQEYSPSHSGPSQGIPYQAGPASALTPPQSGFNASLECNYSSAIDAVELAKLNTAISLHPRESTSIGRQHQINFFERLLPRQEDVTGISRTHLHASYSPDKHSVEIMNLSQNAVKVDDADILLGQKGVMKIGSTLKFTAPNRTLLSFMLKFS